MSYWQWLKWQLERVEHRKYGPQMMQIAFVFYFFCWFFSNMFFARDGGYIQPDWAQAGCIRGSIGGECVYPSTRPKCKDYQ